MSEDLKYYNQLFYKAKTWEVAGGEDEFNELSDYQASDDCKYTVVISVPQYIFDDDIPGVGVNYCNTNHYAINFMDNYQIILKEDVFVNLKRNRLTNKLELSGYENEYQLLMYDSVANKTIKYKVIKEKEVEGYHPLFNPR